MKAIKLTVRHDRNGTLSLWLQSDKLGEHRAGYALAENPNHSDFYARVAEVQQDYDAKGVAVTFVDEAK